MRITRLRLRNLRRHADLDMQPAPGLTVVRGPNESGKTSVQLAIELALFGEGQGEDGARLRRWNAPANPGAVATTARPTSAAITKMTRLLMPLLLPRHGSQPQEPPRYKHEHRQLRGATGHHSPHQ